MVFLIIWLVIVIYPLLRHHFRGADRAIPALMKGDFRSRATKILFIFPGMAAQEAWTFQRFYRYYNGDVVFVDYGEDTCALATYAKQVVEYVDRYGYEEVDILGISIGAQVFSELAVRFSKAKSGVKLRFWAICPFEPEVANEKVAKLSHVLCPILVVLKFALGVLGELPIIKWDYVWRSPASLIGQAYLATYGRPLQDFPYERGEKPWRRFTPTKLKYSSGEHLIRGVVYAAYDEFTDIAALEDRYAGIPSKALHRKHCDFNSGGDAYVAALTRLGLYQ